MLETFITRNPVLKQLFKDDKTTADKIVSKVLFEQTISCIYIDDEVKQLIQKLLNLFRRINGEENETLH